MKNWDKFRDSVMSFEQFKKFECSVGRHNFEKIQKTPEERAISSMEGDNNTHYSRCSRCLKTETAISALR